MSTNSFARLAVQETFERQDTVVLVPGWNDSGPGHWQSVWEALLPETLRVQQKNWKEPLLEDWLMGLKATIRRANTPVVLVGHSLGCILLAHYFARVRPVG